MSNIEKTNFYNYFLPDSYIQEIKINSDKVEIDIYWEVKKKIIKIICQEVVGITDLCMWEDSIIGDNVCLKEVDYSSNDFLIRVYNAHQYVCDCGKTLRDRLLQLSIELTNNISFCVYCYRVMVEE